MSATVADRRALVALTSLPRMGPARVHALLGGGEPAAVLDAVRRARVAPTAALQAAAGSEGLPALLERWAAAARDADVDELWRAHHDRGIAVLMPGDPTWPFDDDPDPPAVLFCLGDTRLLRPEVARVALIGTRRCTAYGVEVAGGMGHDLAIAGVSVVSGLAAGIDGAAHVGVLEALRGGAASGGTRAAPPIGIAATGLDVPYPRHHRHLWRTVAEAGLLLSEVPVGTPPARWRFPARNRIIASLSAATVVIESAERGGSMHTVDEAVRRDRPVLAVPGPVTSAASRGTNRLLADGAAPACDVADVLLAIGRPPATRPEPSLVAGTPTGEAGRVLDAIHWEPSTLDQVLLRCDSPLGVVTTHLHELEATGWIRMDGGWIERRR